MRKYYKVWKLNQENWAKRGRNAHEEIVTYHHWKKNWTRKFSCRCKESQDAKKELNSTYKIDKKKFDRELGKKQVNAGWLKREGKRSGELEQVWEEILVEDLKKALRKSRKWESPRICKATKLWLNTLISILRNIINYFNRAIIKKKKKTETNPKRVS